MHDDFYKKNPNIHIKLAARRSEKKNPIQNDDKFIKKTEKMHVLIDDVHLLFRERTRARTLTQQRWFVFRVAFDFVEIFFVARIVGGSISTNLLRWLIIRNLFLFPSKLNE